MSNAHPSKNNEPTSSVKLGQVYRATRDVPTLGIITYKAPASSGFDCIIPQGTRIIIMNNPPQNAKGVWAMPLNYGELEKKLVPTQDLDSPKYQGYGLMVTFEYLERLFMREVVQEVVFDDKRAQEEWKNMLGNSGSTNSGNSGDINQFDD